MRRLLLIVALALVTLIVPAPAGAHFAWCGHTTRWFSDGSEYARYIATLRNPHRHRYEHWIQLPSSLWIHSHNYVRRCPAH